MEREKRFFIWDYIVTGVSLLAAFPAAYMVGRSVYHWLILGWFKGHTQFWPVLGVLTAIVAAIVVEGLGTVSMFEWLTFRRWNNWKATRIDIDDDGKITRTLKRGYDLAPERNALACFVAYIVVAVALLVVLEYRSDFATFAPVLFPVLTGVGALTGSMFSEHKDRLAYHGLTWDWQHVPEPKEAVALRSETVPTQTETAPELDETRRAILDLWRSDPTLTLEQVGERFGKSKSWANRQKTGLERENLVRYDAEQGEWSVLWSGNGHGKG